MQSKVMKLGLSLLCVILLGSILFRMFTTHLYEKGITTWVPDDGIWYCEDLQMQLNFENRSASFAILDGKKILCATSNDRGSLYTGLCRQQSGIDAYPLGATVFYGKYIDMNEKEFVLEEVDTGLIYVFLKVE